VRELKNPCVKDDDLPILQLLSDAR